MVLLTLNLSKSSLLALNSYAVLLWILLPGLELLRLEQEF